MQISARVMVLLVMTGAAACSTPPQGKTTLPPLMDFCGEAQMLIAKTTLQPQNIVLSAEEFGQSKATIRPLSTRQSNSYADAAQTQLTQISCKMKTADHLRTEYGTDAAGPEGLCADINRRTLAAVLDGYTPTQRRALRYAGGSRVVFDAEQVTSNGREWLAPYPLAWEGPDGQLHILAKAQRNDWLDQRYVDADPKFRGTRYCHLIAPDYLRRILEGAVEVGTTPPPPLGPPIR